MRRGLLLFVGLLAILLAGCTMLDSLAGVTRNADGTVVVDPGGGLAGTAARALESMPGWLGFAGAGLTAGIALYQKARRKTAEQGMTSIVTGLDAALGHGERTDVAKADLYAAIQAATNAKADSPEAVAAMIARIKAQARPVTPPPTPLATPAT